MMAEQQHQERALKVAGELATIQVKACYPGSIPEFANKQLQGIHQEERAQPIALADKQCRVKLQDRKEGYEIAANVSVRIE